MMYKKPLWFVFLGTMPEEYEMYYGFTRLAMELNEIDPDMAKYLPITDTRFRPDQRYVNDCRLLFFIYLVSFISSVWYHISLNDLTEYTLDRKIYSLRLTGMHKICGVCLM